MLSIRIYKLRTARGMSQSQLAEQLNFSPSTIGMYEQGRRIPGIDTLVALSKVFHVSLDYLVTGAEFSSTDQLHDCHHSLPLQHTYTDMILGGSEMDRAALGQKLREARLKKGYTQQLLAEEAGIGIMYLSEIERGLKMPSLNSFIQLIEALDISADYVLRDELTSGKEYIYDELTEKLKNLTPKQRKTATDILDAYIRNLD